MSNMTLDDLFEDSFRVINERFVNGTAISPTSGNYVDIKSRMYAPANSTYQELGKISKIPGVKSYSHHMPTNLLGLYAFDEVEHSTSDIVYTATGAQSISFEVDNECTVKLQEMINGVLTNITGTYIVDGVISSFTGTITVPNTVTSYTNYKALLTLSSTSNYVYMTFTGSYPYFIRYRGMFAQKYPTVARVPALRPYVQYDAPTDMMQVNEVLYSYDQRQYQPFVDYVMKNGKFELPWGQRGQFDLHYWVYPERITTSTVGSFEFKNGMDAQSIMCYAVGGEAIMPDDKVIGTTLLNLYQVKKDSIQPTATSNPVEIQNSMWGVK